MSNIYIYLVTLEKYSKYIKLQDVPKSNAVEYLLIHSISNDLLKQQGLST